MPIPPDELDFLKENCQVFLNKAGKNKWMKRTALKAAVLAGKADGWWIVAIDPETAEPSLICPYCAVGVEHRGTLH
jgi:hypothetical protein